MQLYMIEWLIFLDQLWKGITRQNATASPVRFEQCKSSLKGNALMLYRLKVANLHVCTVNEFDTVLSSMTELIFLVHAYHDQL